ncbi:hypothetical protein C7S10_15920 [Nocardioides currus]|uniref:Uncharacterized protein n=1 Tax=Nocardioides currus TaxID=2133958 RepID=A0A2R7YUN0_9ACTN|nr:hypothetical protein C7S10_15920 [Nocardioides currus]
MAALDDVREVLRELREARGPADVGALDPVQQRSELRSGRRCRGRVVHRVACVGDGRAGPVQLVAVRRRLWTRILDLIGAWTDARRPARLLDPDLCAL